MEISDAVKVKECANEIMGVLGKHFPTSPGDAFTSMIYLLVQLTEILEINPELVMRSLKEAFELQKLMKAETPNDFIN